jgi:hypothetical protein
MYFIVGLPLTARKFDSIWVIVDRLTKSAHFILVHTKYQVEKYAEIYIARVLCLHGVQRQSSLIEGHILLLASGNNCMLPLGLA